MGVTIRRPHQSKLVCMATVMLQQTPAWTPILRIASELSEVGIYRQYRPPGANRRSVYPLTIVEIPVSCLNRFPRTNWLK